MTYHFKKFNLEEHIVILFPLFFLSGPFLTDLAIIIIDLLFIAKIFYKKNFTIEIYKNYLLFSFYFFLMLLISAILSDNVKLYLFDTLPLIRFIIFPFALLKILNKKISESYSDLLMVIFFLLLIDTIFQLYFGYNLLGFELIDDRPTSIFKNEQIIGSYTIRNLSFIIPIYLLTKNKFNYKFFSILIIACILIILSKERVSFFYLIIFLVFLLIYLFSINKNKTKFLFFKIVPVTFLIVVFLSFVDGEQIKNRIFQTTDVLTDKQDIYFDQDVILSKKDKTFDNIYIFSSEHENYILTSLKIFNSNKFFGAGVKSYRNQCKLDEFKINQFSCSSHPHNTYAQLLSEVGILGTLPIIFIFLLASYNIVKILSNVFLKNKNKSSLKNVFFILPVIISFFPILPSGNIFNNYLASYYAFSVGIFIYYLIEEKRKTKKK